MPNIYHIKYASFYFRFLKLSIFNLSIYAEGNYYFLLLVHRHVLIYILLLFFYSGNYTHRIAMFVVKGALRSSYSIKMTGYMLSSNNTCPPCKSHYVADPNAFFSSIDTRKEKRTILASLKDHFLD